VKISQWNCFVQLIYTNKKEEKKEITEKNSHKLVKTVFWLNILEIFKVNTIQWTLQNLCRINNKQTPAKCWLCKVYS
jgi:hypothetical protein